MKCEFQKNLLEKDYQEVGKDSSVEAGGIRIDCSSKGTSVLVGNELDLAKKKSSPKNLAFLAAFLCRPLGVFLRFVEENPVTLISGKWFTERMK